jgi:MFS family permease
VAALSVNIQSFALFVVAALLTGAGSSFFQQFRFAAIESLKSPDMAGPALSAMMLFTVAGAFLGPELGTLGHKMLDGYAEYTGSYLILASVIIVAIVIFSMFENPPTKEEESSKSGRSGFDIAKQPVFIVALLSACIGYAVMSFIMTSTPLSMHQLQSHSLADSKWVIQSHMAAMFLPSLFSGFLLKRFGPSYLMITGSILYLLVAVVALSGQAVVHYWWALLILGVGWNLLFLSGTTLLPSAYKHNERFKAQAINDFTVFSLQALASLSAGWVLISYGWNTTILICIPLTLVVLITAAYYQFGISKRESKT